MYRSCSPDTYACNMLCRAALCCLKELAALSLRSGMLRKQEDVSDCIPQQVAHDPIQRCLRIKFGLGLLRIV